MSSVCRIWDLLRCGSRPQATCSDDVGSGWLLLTARSPHDRWWWSKGGVAVRDLGTSLSKCRARPAAALRTRRPPRRGPERRPGGHRRGDVRSSPHRSGIRGEGALRRADRAWGRGHDDRLPLPRRVGDHRHQALGQPRAVCRPLSRVCREQPGEWPRGVRNDGLLDPDERRWVSRWSPCPACSVERVGRRRRSR